MQTIAVTVEMAAELTAAVEAHTGECPDIRGFHGRLTPDDQTSLAYIGPNPGIVGFELIVILAGQVAHQACRAGYKYVASDFVDEMRHLVMTIQSPQTEAVGRDLVYYWPTVALVD